MSMSINVKASLLAAVRHSVGSRMFRELYADEDGVTKEILQDGRLSCAFFVAFLLYHFHLIKQPHATVQSTVKDMIESGWTEASVPQEGDVLLWDASQDHVEGEMHQHIGFFLGDGQAISNSSTQKEIIEHEWTFNGSRHVQKIFRAPHALIATPSK